MRVTYTLQEPELGGGVKVALQHAELLGRRGHRVQVIAEGERPSWSAFHGPFHHLDAVRSGELSLDGEDLVIATYWKTIPKVLDHARGPVAHFCQGYEGGLEHLHADRAAIESLYRRSIPTFTVTPSLAAELERRFGRPCCVTPPPIDPLFRPRYFKRRPSQRPWILVPGVFEAPVKGVPTALEAAARLRDEMNAKILRISSHPQTAAEKDLAKADVYFEAQPPSIVAKAVRNCDLLLFNSRPDEGFGLPLLEAARSRVPAVVRRIPSTDFMLPEGPIHLDEPSADDFVRAARALLTNPRRWRTARRRAYALTRRFRSTIVGAELEDAVRWAARFSKQS